VALAVQGWDTVTPLSTGAPLEPPEPLLLLLPPPLPLLLLPLLLPLPLPLLLPPLLPLLLPVPGWASCDEPDEASWLFVAGGPPEVVAHAAARGRVSARADANARARIVDRFVFR
jgi:hypothetical protein